VRHFFSRGTSPKNKKLWEKKSDDVSYFGEGGGGESEGVFLFFRASEFLFD
jgi:hypothetical protein